MKWWYEPEEEMKTCKECKHTECDNHGGEWYTLDCPNNELKGVSMEFDRNRCYTALNADELRAGDKVIVADNLADLKTSMQSDYKVKEILFIHNDTNLARFEVRGWGSFSYIAALAYLVERKENCTNCEEAGKKGGCRRHGEIDKILCCDCYTPKTEKNCTNCSHSCKSINPCLRYEPKTEPKAENCTNCKHYNKRNDFRDCTLVDNPTASCPHWEAEKKYRPFKDTDELVKVWCDKGGKWQKRELTMPHIWVREKGCDKSADLITCYGSKGITVRGKGMYFDTLFTMFEFLDGSPCGVEE